MVANIVSRGRVKRVIGSEVNECGKSEDLLCVDDVCFCFSCPLAGVFFCGIHWHLGIVTFVC